MTDADIPRWQVPPSHCPLCAKPTVTERPALSLSSNADSEHPVPGVLSWDEDACERGYCPTECSFQHTAHSICNCRTLALCSQSPRLPVYRRLPANPGMADGCRQLWLCDITPLTSSSLPQVRKQRAPDLLCDMPVTGALQQNTLC